MLDKAAALLDPTALLHGLSSAVFGTVKSVIEGAASSRAKDVAAAVKSRMAGRLPLPENHDLVRGIRTAQLAALDKVALRYEKRLRALPADDVSLAEQKFADELRVFLDGRLGLLGARIDHVVLDEATVQRVLDDMVHPSDVEGFAAAARASRDVSERAMLDEIERTVGLETTSEFADMFDGRTGAAWYDTFALFVNEEIKTSERFRSIFLAAELVDIKRLVGAAERRIEELIGAGVERIEARLNLIESKLDGVRENADAIREDARTIRAQLDLIVRAVMPGLEQERLRQMEIGSVVILELARQRRPGTSFSFEEAVAEVRSAVELAIEVVEKGRRPTDLGEFVDDVLKRIAVRTQASDFNGGSAEADQAFAEWQRAEQERRHASHAIGVRILEAGIDQDVLRRDFGSAAQRVAAIVDLQEADPIRRFAALRYRQDAFYAEGRDKGNRDPLEMAIAIARLAVQRATDADERGRALNDLGTALWILGDRENGKARLEEAVATYREALKELTQARVPLDWGATQNNLSAALRSLGGRESGTVRLKEAVEACRAALEEWTRDLVPLDWAMAHHNLGNALRALGERESGTAHLEDAVLAYKTALEERTRERAPLDWAMTKNSLGNAFFRLGERESASNNLRQAVLAYRAALEERTRELVPLDWAMTQNNLGNALRALGEREGEPDALNNAVLAYQAALEEWTRERVPLDWAMTQSNLGTALRALGERESGTTRLKEAVLAYRAALGERTRELVPLDWAMTQNNLGNALRILGIREIGTTHLEEAILAHRAGLEERTRERVPLDWAISLGGLGAAQHRIAERRKDLVQAEDALSSIETALAVASPHAPLSAWLADEAVMARQLVACLSSGAP